MRQVIPPGSFHSISSTIQAILSILDHVKYELLNQDELQQVKYQEATLA